MYNQIERIVGVRRADDCRIRTVTVGQELYRFM